MVRRQTPTALCVVPPLCVSPSALCVVPPPFVWSLRPYGLGILENPAGKFGDWNSMS